MTKLELLVEAEGYASVEDFRNATAPTCSLGMCTNVDGMRVRTIAAAVAQQVEHDEPVARWHERHDAAPQMARRGEAMEKHDGRARPSRTRRVVVDSRAGEVEEFAAHRW